MRERDRQKERKRERKRYKEKEKERLFLYEGRERGRQAVTNLMGVHQFVQIFVAHTSCCACALHRSLFCGCMNIHTYVQMFVCYICIYTIIGVGIPKHTYKCMYMYILVPMFPSTKVLRYIHSNTIVLTTCMYIHT